MLPESLGLTADQVRQVLEAAAQAPSVHNAQPWSYQVFPDRIELRADLSRRLPAADKDDRELRLGLGASLMNLKLALLNAGVRPSIQLRPAGSPGVEAVVTSLGHGSLDETTSRLHAMIGQRRTNRKQFEDGEIPMAHQEQLIRAAEAEKAWLQVVNDQAQKARLVQLSDQAFRVQAADPAYVAEFQEWIGRPPKSPDGVPQASAGPAPESQDKWVKRDFSGGQVRHRMVGHDFEKEPLLAVLASYNDAEFGQLQAGMGMQRMLLTATSLGLAASFLSQVIEVDNVRVQLQQLLGGTVFPQSMIRLGFGTPVPPTPRRPVEEFAVAG